MPRLVDASARDRVVLKQKAGARTVTLWMTDVNGRARAFYDRLGFEPTGSRAVVTIAAKRIKARMVLRFVPPVSR